jgi:hypothetical protein
MATFGDSRPYGSCRLVAALMVYVESATIMVRRLLVTE